MARSDDIQKLAADAAKWFEVARRPDDSAFIRTKDDAPEWISEFVREAHGTDMLPDDWRYQVIWNALEQIELADDPDEASAEFADQQVDVYSADRIAWLASNINRAAYVDDARENFGPTSSVIDDIGAGQYQEAGEIYGRVLWALEQIISAGVEL